MKKLLSLVLAAVMLALSVAAQSSVELPEVRIGDTFSDVEAGRWSYDSVYYAFDNGYMLGVGGNRFDPEGTMTRAMVVTVLWRREKSPAIAYSPVFKDVKDGEWYTTAVLWAKGCGVVNGTSETTFSPEDEIKREQLVTMLCRYTDYKELDTSSKASIAQFPDANAVSGWAKAAVIWATDKGLIKGNRIGGKDYIEPQGNATREQFAAILERYDGTDFSFPLAYNSPVVFSSYTEKEYDLQTDADIFVAPNGNDENNGSFDHPLATFDGAVAAVRRLKETKTEGGIKVAFMAGEYKAPVGLTLTAEDSGTADNPITYCKYGDGDVVFNAGVSVPADKFEALGDDAVMFPEKYRGRIMRADLREYGVDPASLGANNNVFAGETRLDLARWPNRLQSGNDDFIGRYQELHEGELSITLLPYDNKRISKYHNVEDMYMSGYYKYDWSASEGPVLFYDPETGYITPTINGYGLHKFQDNTPCPYYYFFNIPDELDRTDECYIDKNTGYLYVMDPAGDYSVALTGQMFTFNNADFISLVGLEFCYATGDFMRGSGADDLTVDQCSFHNFRGYGFLMDGDRATFTNNEFYDVGGRNIDLKTGDRETLTSGGSVIENNLFEHFGYVNKTMSPAVRVWGCGVRIAHNEMCDSSNSAVTYSESVWPSNYITVEYNYIHSVVTQSTDFGAIYAGRNLAGHGCVVRYNIVADVGNRLEQHNSLGLYLDDSESGQEVYGNIFFNTANHAIFTNGGRENKIYNNVIIEPDQNTGSEILLGDSMYTSIEGETDGFTKPIAEDERITILELVPFRNELWASAFPTLAAYKYDLSDMAPYADDPDCPINPSYDEIYGNVIVATKGHIGEGVLDTYAERVVTFGTRVENSTVYPIEENPFFADPTNGDYRIDSEKAGFEIPYELIGRY